MDDERTRQGKIVLYPRPAPTRAVLNVRRGLVYRRDVNSLEVPFAAIGGGHFKLSLSAAMRSMTCADWFSVGAGSFAGG
jgi:hypothetical protein